MAASFARTSFFLNLACKNAKTLTQGLNFLRCQHQNINSRNYSRVTKDRTDYSCEVDSQIRERNHSQRIALKSSRQVRVDTDTHGLKLTFYQYQTCPWCCKTRAFLDYHGFSYDVVEVNSLTKKQLRWSDYRKIPILMVEGQGGDLIQMALRDSTNIISILESYVHDKTISLQKYNSFFPCIEEKAGKKTKYEFPNKYVVVNHMNQVQADPERVEERKWREWADTHWVHMLTPNPYRTISESLHSFRYFAEVGQWEKNFSYIDKQAAVYAGATIMHFVGLSLAKKHSLKDDVRESMYDACNEWMDAVGKKRPFMGGDQPNLADLSVYGVLNSIEGCNAFVDAATNSKIAPWYYRTKKAVDENQGVSHLKAKRVASKNNEAISDIEQTLHIDQAQV